LLRRNFSEANKEQSGALLGEFWTTISSDIAESRNIPVTQVDAVAENILVRLPVDAVNQGLIYGMLYKDE
jgi:protease-4